MCFADTLQVTGVVTPRSEILARPDRDGLQISQVLVEAGDTVVSGQVLARLTPPEGQTGSGATVQAPAAGVISSRNAVVGTMASTRAEPLFRIAVNEEMELLGEALDHDTFQTCAQSICKDRDCRRRRIEWQGAASLDLDQSNNATWPNPSLHRPRSAATGRRLWPRNDPNWQALRRRHSVFGGSLWPRGRCRADGSRWPHRNPTGDRRFARRRTGGDSRGTRRRRYGRCTCRGIRSRWRSR